MRKRELAARTLTHGAVQRLWRFAGGGNRGLRIVAYHRVLDDDPATFPFDEELISATSAAFQTQMEFVRRHFQVVSFADLHRCALEDKPWPDRALIVTFDDGYADNYSHAFPILKEKDLPATVFLATSFMESGRLFWWDLVAYCFKQTALEAVQLPEIASESLLLSDAMPRRQSINRVLLWTKRAADATKNEFLQRLPQILEVEIPANLGHGMHLSWPQVREMAQHGIEFGAHSISHPILTNVEHEQLKLEIRGSKRAVEEHLGGEALTFCYPAGQFNAAVQDEVRSAGFRFATAFHEAISHSKPDHFALPRIHVERDDSLSLFQSNLMFPSLMLRGDSSCEIS